MSDDVQSHNPLAPGFVEAMRQSVQSGPSVPSAPSEKASSEENPAGAAAPASASSVTEEAVVDAIKTVYDPEIPVNIYEIGLIYNVIISPGGLVEVKMTLTSPACPAAQEIPAQVKDRVEAIAGVTRCDVEIVWDPQWNPSMMSEAARLELGMF
jgi:FeS assembly SUF system protein